LRGSWSTPAPHTFLLLTQTFFFGIPKKHLVGFGSFLRCGDWPVFLRLTFLLSKTHPRGKPTRRTTPAWGLEKGFFGAFWPGAHTPLVRGPVPTFFPWGKNPFFPPHPIGWFWPCFTKRFFSTPSLFFAFFRGSIRFPLFFALRGGRTFQVPHAALHPSSFNFFVFFPSPAAVNNWFFLFGNNFDPPWFFFFARVNNVLLRFSFPILLGGVFWGGLRFQGVGMLKGGSFEHVRWVGFPLPTINPNFR